MAGLGIHSPKDKSGAFDSARNIRLVPPFQEKEVDKYFALFEKVDDSLNWPKEIWVLLLQSVLVGKAQEIYGSLSVEQSSNYKHVKEAILKAYKLVPEAYRQKFRNYLKYDSKTHVEFAREKENLFNRWCHPKEIGQNFKKLKQMVLLEEFKDKDRPDIISHLHVDEQKVEELEKAAVKADDYALTHKMSSKSDNPQQKRYHGSKGTKVNPLHNDKSCIEDKISPETESDYMENYKPFISEGVVSLVGDENSSQKVKILRDTGATQSLMLHSLLPLTENSFTGANVLISGVEMGVLVPLHEVNIKSSLINGNIVIGMRSSLPVEGISLILVNDLAGEKVMVDPRVVQKPRDDEITERLAEKFPGIFPASVVTCSMKAKKEAIKEQGKEEIGLLGTFLENMEGEFEERNKEKAEKALMRYESRNVKGNIPGKQEGESKSVISRQNLIEEQSNVTITPLLLLKEKWLDEDPEKISVQKYVGTFKDYL